MKWFFLILLAALIFILLLFLFALRIKLVFNSDKPEINMKLLWLNSFICAFITIENTIPILKVYLFNQLILKRTMKKGKNRHSGMELVKLSNPRDIHVNVHYGFRDPFTTGIACGAINMASQFINIDSMDQTPDFLSMNDYIYLDATAKVNLGSTLIKLLMSKSSK